MLGITVEDLFKKRKNFKKCDIYNSCHTEFIRTLFPDIHGGSSSSNNCSRLNFVSFMNLVGYNSGRCGVDLCALSKSGRCIEIKECTISKVLKNTKKKVRNYNRNDYKITILPKDLNPDYILALFWVDMTFYLIKQSDLCIKNRNFKKTSVFRRIISKNYTMKWSINRKSRSYIFLDIVTYINCIRLGMKV